MSLMTVPVATQPIRVMVVDDSALMRKLLSEMLSRSPEIEIIDTAMDGQFALDHLRRVKPDVVLLDVDMPRLDGLATLDRIVAEHGLPVVMCSALTRAGAETTLEALKRGAVDFIEKPSMSVLTSGEGVSELVERVRGAASARVGGRRSIQPERLRQSGPLKVPDLPSPPAVAHTSLAQVRKLASQVRPDIVAIGTSTGGPPALESVLTALPADFRLGIVVVQHMPAGFTKLMAEHLDLNAKITVREAVDGEPVQPGVALIAPGGAHLRVTRAQGQYRVSVDPIGALVSGHRPSVDVLFESVANAAKGRAAAFLMTGMGSDGAEGLGLLARAGALTIAQAPETCVVAGMPKSAIDRGYARAVLPLEDLALALNACNPSAHS